MSPSRGLIRRPRRPPGTIVAVRKAGQPSVPVTLAASAVLVLAVALVDYATGTELRVFPLYFLPILAVSLRLGRWPGLGTAAACAAAWGLSNQVAGMTGSRPGIGLANLLVMATAFGAIALLGARQREWLLRERAISRTDSLTGLLNGRGFYEAAAVELARSSRYRHPLTLVYVDLDDFKGINDRFGHTRGDAVLVAVARALHRACRSTDLVGRLGGDEFVILFPETGRDAAEAALVKLRSRVQEAGSQDGSPVTASIGSVSFAKPPADVEALVHEADTAMYAAKASGKNALRCLSYGENQ
jgi:diguanylate cyclase (GGDEF)-like protein